MTTVTNCLSESRNVARTYSDGSIECPFCYNVIAAGTAEYKQGKCENPGCFAHPAFPQDQAVRLAEKAAQHKREAEQRQHILELAMVRQQKDLERNQRNLDYVKQEAQMRGACVKCSLESLRLRGFDSVKYPKHRKQCPKS